MNWFDRLLFWIAPAWGLSRVKARVAGERLRHYEAASHSRRTKGWKRTAADANTVQAVARTELRLHARDLLRNNGYAKRARNTIRNNVVGWGTRVRSPDARAREVWAQWADETSCDADGNLTFAGVEALVMGHVFADGEVLVRRRVRRPSDGLAIPMQLQVLEADYLDNSRDTTQTMSGGRIVQGIEYDAIGKRVGYWIFDSHPGSTEGASTSKRVPASEIHHVFEVERAGQGRGVSWLGAAIVDLKDLSDYDDAELVKQKIAACFAAFVVDTDGGGLGVGKEDEKEPELRGLEPGMIQSLPGGRDVRFASPPSVTDASFTARALRRVAAGIGITYEDLTGDYSQVNFSSARMGRQAHEGNVKTWQRDLTMPFVARVWGWAMELLVIGGQIPEVPLVTCTPAPLPMLEPDKEALSAQRRVRGGMATFSEIVREQGEDPDEFFAEYAADKKRLDKLGIKLDSDVAAVSQAGLTQERAGAGGKSPEADAKDEKDSVVE